MTETNGAASQPVGSLRRARRLFAEELARLDVMLDERAALDGLLDEMASQFGISRPSLIRGYLNEETLRRLARRAAEEATGWDASLHEARQRVVSDRPESADWPVPVRNYLVDHYAIRSGAETLAQLFFGEGAGVEDKGLLRFSYRHSVPLGQAPGFAGDGTVAVVSAQHRSLVRPGRPLVADTGWGRPEFEWAYELIGLAYRRRTGIRCDRLLWAWADTAMAAAGHHPDLMAPEAREMLAGIGGPGAVAVAAKVPAERCLLTSHIIWDALVLRGRYIPADIDDALRFHADHGSTHIDGNDRGGVLEEAVFQSWEERFFGAPADRSFDVRLQVCVDRIDPDDVIEVIDIDDLPRPPVSWTIGQGVDPRPLTERTGADEHR